MNRTGIFAIFLLIVALALSIPGCQAAKEKVEAAKPEIKGTSLEWGEVTSSTTELIATIDVYNPNPISLPIKKVVCDVTMNDIHMGSAETKDLSIKKNTESSLKIAASIDNSKIPEFWTEHLRQDEQSTVIVDVKTVFDLIVTDFTYPFQKKTSIQTNLLGNMSKAGPIPLEEKIELPTGQEETIFKASLESLSGKWGDITSDSAEMLLSATVDNQNPYPLTIPKIINNIDINDIPMVSGESETDYTVPPKSKTDINATATADFSHMDEWFVSHIQNGEKSTFNYQISLAIDLPGEVAEQLGQEKLVLPVWEGSKTFTTNIIGAKK
ncbi:MAG: LEA type 2 family protein [Dehalococcoidia bacterium]